MKKENLKEQNKPISLEEEPSFDIHKMPKGYKVGRFELDNNTSNKGDNDSKKSSTNSSWDNKKIGVLIVSLGVVVVLFLGYLIFSYIGNPDFSLAGLFKFNNKVPQETQVTPSPSPSSTPTPPLNNIETDTPPEEDVFPEEDPALEEDLIPEEDEGSIDDEDTLENDIDDINDIIESFVDSDEDGLSDDEEIILGTDFSRSDSDGDGYDDSTEILNLYNPVGDGLLSENENIAMYKNEPFNYSIFHPVSWEKSVLSDESSIIFSINESSFIQILVEKSDPQVDIESWYTSRFFKTVEPSYLVEKNGWTGVYSEDGLALYLSDGVEDNIYTILYSSPENQPLIYINIFKMIVNSFLAELSD